MKSLFPLFVLLFVLNNPSFAANFYWIGGSGTWNNVAHWSNTNGGPSSGTVPGNTDDVFFTSLSGMVAGSTLTFPTSATSTCRNLTFMTGVAGINIRGAGSARFDLNGSATLEAGMNFGTGAGNTAALAWLGSWYCYQSVSGTVNTITTANNTFYNTLMRFELPSSGTGNDFQVIGDFNMFQAANNVLEFNLQTNAHNVFFNNNCNWPRGVRLIKGTAQTLMGYNQPTLVAAAYYTIIDAAGSLMNYGPVTAGVLTIGGRVLFNGGNTAVGNIINYMEVEEGTGGPYLLDFNNCLFYIGSFFTFGGQSSTSSIANRTINAAGSTLHFTSTATLMRHSGHTFNNIIVDNNANGTGFFSFTVYGLNIIHTPTIDSLIINRNVNFDYARSGATIRASDYRITGLFKLAAGISCDGNVGHNQFDMIGGATLDMVGDCDNPIFMYNTTHNLSGVGPMMVDHLIMDQVVRALPAGPYFAGANSIAITGSNIIGWTFAARTPRTLVWTGGCNLSPVVTLPTAPANNSNAINTGLNFTPNVAVSFRSVDIYASNTSAVPINLSFRITQNGTGATMSTIVATIPPSVSNFLITLNFNVTLPAGFTYRIQRITSGITNLRINPAPVFPIDIVANDSRCLVGTITGGLPTASIYYNFFNWNIFDLASPSLGWYNSLNWCDVTSNPTWTSDPQIAPNNAGYCGSVCPPTEIDSVIFPDGSIVLANQPTQYCEGMNWLGTGRFIGNTNQDMEVWGALHLSAQMINNFGGTFKFRSNRPYICHITTNNKQFRYGVLFNSQNGNGQWLLIDALRTIVVDPETSSSNTGASFQMSSGHLHTGTINCLAGNGQMIEAFGMIQSGGILSLYDSDIFIIGNARGPASTTSFFNFNFSLGGILNAGTSNFIFENRDVNSSFGGNSTYYSKAILGSKVYYEVTIKKPTLNTPTNYSHIVAMGGSSIYKLNLENNTWPIIQAGTTPSQIQLIESTTTMDVSFGQATTSVGFGSGATSIPYVPDNTRTLIVDSLVQTIPNTLNLGTKIKINSIFSVFPGTVINFETGVTCDMSAANSYISPYLPTCPGGGTASYLGARLLIDGSCFNGNVTINGGSFISNTTLPINTQYLTINNNTVTGPNAPFNTANSILTGTTTGWNGIPSLSRKLRWKDTSTTASNLGNFQDATYWEQIFPTPLPAPQCPPTQIDTVLFDNTSFSATGQQVELTGLTDVASMYWESIPAGQAPQLVGVTIQNLTIRCNLFFHANMVNNHLGEVYFRGAPSVAFPLYYIRSSGKFFNRSIYFTADHDNTEWHLLDDLRVLGANDFLYLNRGRLITDGHQLTVGRFASQGALKRHLDIRNSWVKLFYSGSGASTISAPEWEVSGTPLVNGKITSFTLNAIPSKIECLAGGQRDEFLLGGHRYDTIISNCTGRMIVGPNAFRRDSINTFIAKGTTLNASSLLVDSLWVGKAELFKPTSIATIGGHYDSLIFRANASITTNNKIHKFLHFEPSFNYTLTGGTVQWVQNAATINLDGGSPTGTIQFYGNPTGSTAFLRKDSAYFCANYVNIRDVWAIGNGNNAANSCFGGSINNNCPHANPWVNSSCDTVTNYADICGPWTSAVVNRGRADFNAGEFADLQGGNVYGWDKRAYPGDPVVDLITPDKITCLNAMDTVTFVFSGVVEPILFIYDSVGVVTSAVLTSLGAGYGTQNLTGSGTKLNPYIWNLIFMVDRTPMSFRPIDVVIERCILGNSTISSGAATFTLEGCILEVELLDFNAVKQNKEALITWQTASERDNAYFEVLRSSNGIDFYTIGLVQGYGNSSNIQNYELLDISPLVGTNYYKLKQVDFDGSFQYSPIKVLSFDDVNIGIYPNPATNSVTIINPYEEAIISILDITGKTVLSQTILQGKQTIDISNLAAGVYIVETKQNQTTANAHRTKLTVVK